MEIGKTYHGFKLTEQSEVDEINSAAKIFVHEKSGAKLLNLASDDDNNVFSISFRTPPEDSTGVAHILEHSVLCGSRKFPVKEPFVELLKGSLKNFLNAFTFPDKTMYPVASKNEKDFFNLMDVYLDAVFYPNIYKNEEIFLQEGWHYNLESKDDEITYKGVVYNEMKGAFSSPESVLFRMIQKTLYPDTTYGVESGGDPDDIPNLTYEQFINFHKKYYHPSNSYIFLYGDIDLEKKLEFLDKEYLSAFDNDMVDSTIKTQSSFEEMSETSGFYPILDDEEENDKTYMALNFVTGSVKDPETVLGLTILEDLLLESSGSQFKKALIESGLGKDVFGIYEVDLMQPVFSIILKNGNASQKEEFKKLVFEELQKLVDNGIDPKLVEASVNKKEFSLRESEGDGYPKGLSYNLTSMTSWLYDLDPLLHLRYENPITSIREKSTKGFFEELIREFFIDNTHSSFVILEPSKGLENRNSQALADNLKEFKDSLSEDDIQNLVDQTINLNKFQSTPDSQEQLNSIPVLDIKDIKKDPEELPLVEKEESVTTLHHPVFTNGIAYIRTMFDSTCIPQQQLSTLSLLDALLGDVDTENYTYMELTNEINTYLGCLNFSYANYVQSDDSTVYYPKFCISSKALVSKVDKMMELSSEVIQRSDFSCKKRLKEIVQKLRSRIEMNIMNSGHSIAYKRIIAQLSQAASYNEQMSGLTFYDYIVDLDENFEDKAESIISDLNKIYKMVFRKENMIVSITADEKDYDLIRDHINNFVDSLDDTSYDNVEYDFKLERTNEGLYIPGQVQYVCKGADFIEAGYEYNGKLKVMQTIARLDYLWNNVRVKGGAYGAMTNFSRSGNMFFVSYRDPNLTETLDIFDQIHSFFADIDLDERELTKYIIGTIANLDHPLTPSAKGAQALNDYISNVSYEQVKKERHEVLATSAEDIKEFSTMLKVLMNNAITCVVGSEKKIKENSEVFDSVKKIID